MTMYPDIDQHDRQTLNSDKYGENYTRIKQR